MKRYHLPINPFSRPGSKLQSTKYIVIHNTGAAGWSKSALERYWQDLSNQDPTDDRPDRYASSQIGIDWTGVYEYIPIDEVAYHAGDKYYNYNSIGIEVCHKTDSGIFEPETVRHLISYVGNLCYAYQLEPRDAVIRHHDVTGKMCPRWYVENPEAWAELVNNITLRKAELMKKGDNHV